MKSVRWIGMVLLQSRSQGAAPSVVEEFLSEWRDHLPESWRTHAALDALRVRLKFLNLVPCVDARRGATNNHPTIPSSSTKADRLQGEIPLQQHKGKSRDPRLESGMRNLRALADRCSVRIF